MNCCVMNLNQTMTNNYKVYEAADHGLWSIQTQEVFELAADGASVYLSATIMHLSEHAIKYHRGIIIEKLSAQNMPHAVAQAFREGILK